MWQTIYDVESVDALQNAVPPIQDLPPGTEVNVHIDLVRWAPFGGLFNMAGAEFWGQQMLGSGFEVIDVSGDWYSIDIKCVATGGWPVALAFAIVVALGAVGVAYYISRIYVTANIVEEKKAEIVQDMLDRGYTPEQIQDTIRYIQPQTPSVPALGAGLAGLSVGVILAIAVGVYFLTRK